MLFKNVMLVLFTGVVFTCFSMEEERKQLVNEPSRFNRVIDAFLRYLATSNSLRQFAKKSQQYPLPSDLLNQSDKYAKLFTQAQRDIGLGEDNLLPIKKMPLNEAETKEVWAATDSKCIAVVEENFDKLPYGARRVISLHEAYHHHFNDSVFQRWGLYELVTPLLILLTLVKSGLLIYKVVKSDLNIYSKIGFSGISPLIALISTSLCLCPLILKLCTKDHFEKYKEFRADLHAVRRAKCLTCVQEFQEICHDHNPFYMNKKEIQYFVDLYRGQNLFCDYHRSQLIV